MSWHFLDSGARSARENMELDRALLEACEEESDPVLHLYDWEEDSITYGHFIDPYSLLKREAVEELSLQIAQRPTGGGVIFHTCDLAFSVLVPASSPYFSDNPLENYAFVNQRVVTAIQRLRGIQGELLQQEEQPTIQDPYSRHFCMAKPTKYDVMVGGKKVGGAAQRKTRHGFLHQGSISLRPLCERYKELFLGEQVFDNMRTCSFTLLGETASHEEFLSMRAELKELLKEVFYGE